MSRSHNGCPLHLFLVPISATESLCTCITFCISLLCVFTLMSEIYASLLSPDQSLHPYVSSTPPVFHEYMCVITTSIVGRDNIFALSPIRFNSGCFMYAYLYCSVLSTSCTISSTCHINVPMI